MSGAQVNGFGEAWPPPASTGARFRSTTSFVLKGANNELKGQPGLVHNSTVEISIEAAFTAVSIGYGVVPKVESYHLRPAASATAESINFQQDSRASLLYRSQRSSTNVRIRKYVGKIGPRTAAVLKDGLRFNPEFAERIFLTGGFES